MEQRVMGALDAHRRDAEGVCMRCYYHGDANCTDNMAADALELIAAQQDYIALLHDRLAEAEQAAAQTQAIRDWVARQMEVAGK